LDTGEIVTSELLRAAIAREAAELEACAGPGEQSFPAAAALFETLSLDPTFPEFLTLPAYEALLARGA
jgi:malate synthase